MLRIFRSGVSLAFEIKLGSDAEGVQRVVLPMSRSCLRLERAVKGSRTTLSRTQKNERGQRRELDGSLVAADLRLLPKRHENTGLEWRWPRWRRF